MKTILLGWNDAEFLPKAIKSLQDQTINDPIIYVDDESTDNSVEIAEKMLTFDKDVIVRLKRKKRVYAGFPILAENVNAGLKYVSENDGFFMIVPSDVIVERNYVKKMLYHFNVNPDLVIASGTVGGEYANPAFPRGAGRIYETGFWFKHIKRFPNAYLWETYPVLKAQSLGKQTANFSDARMLTLRPTRLYKPMYGYTMKELGYPRSYAYFRCLLAFVLNPKIGFEMFRTYNTDIEPIFDKELVSWLHLHHKVKLVHMIIYPVNLVRFLKNKIVKGD